MKNQAHQARSFRAEKLTLYDAPVVHIEGVVGDAQVVAMLNGLIASTTAD